MEAKITALEEEISILKGEIKSILQEVRTAVLAAENPFAGGSATRSVSRAIEADPAPEVKVVPLVQPPPGPVYTPTHEMPAVQALQPETAPTPSPITGPEAGRPRYEADGDELPAAGPRPAERPTTVSRVESHEPYRPALRREHGAGPNVLPLFEEDDEVEDEDEASGHERRLDVLAIAALMVWVEETRQRLDDRHLRIVLGLGRYGGVIDSELETVLIEVSGLLGPTSNAGHVSVNDCLVALRQLDAVLSDGAVDEVAVARRRRRRGRRSKQHMEVQPSKRQ